MYCVNKLQQIKQFLKFITLVKETKTFVVAPMTGRDDAFLIKRMKIGDIVNVGAKNLIYGSDVDVG